MSMSLTKKKCEPVEKGTKPIENAEADELAQELNGWVIVGDHHLEKEFTFPNFIKALSFTNEIGKLAEEEQHHPDIHLSWGKVRIAIWTHSINGLSQNDFILAAKIDELPLP